MARAVSVSTLFRCVRLLRQVICRASALRKQARCPVATASDFTLLVQLAKAYGAYVVTTCSPHSRDLVQSLGPDEILDYKERDIVEQLTEKYKDKPFDMVFDTVGANSELYPKSPRYLKVRGTLSPCTYFSR